MKQVKASKRPPLQLSVKTMLAATTMIVGTSFGQGGVSAYEAQTAMLVTIVDVAAFSPVAETPARIQRLPRIRYPESALKKGQQGWVVIGLDVAHDGKPVNLRVLDSRGARALKVPAKRALKRFRFEVGSLPTGTLAYQGLKYKVTYQL